MGILHPDILENLLSAKQLAELRVYYSLEPFGEEAEWLRTARWCCLYYNSKIGKDGKRAEVDDFLPIYLQETKKGKQNNMLAFVRSISKRKKKKK